MHRLSIACAHAHSQSIVTRSAERLRARAFPRLNWVYSHAGGRALDAEEELKKIVPVGQEELKDVEALARGSGVD